MDSKNFKIPVWLDCDPGHDDAFAILLAAHHPAIDLLGVSTVHGNSSLDHTTQNAGSVLTAIGRPGVPVYAGASQGLTRPAVHAPAIHGESGLDGTALLPRPLISAIRSVSAVDAMAKSLFASPLHAAWLVATGTLTNIAQLITKYPLLVHHIKGLSIMGGAIGGCFTDAPLGKVGITERFGNWTPYAEFNIVCDPEAAHILFSNSELAAKMTMVPLDVTHQVLANEEVQRLLLYGPSTAGISNLKKPSILRIMLVELLNFFAQTYADVFGITEGPPLHDPLAVAAVFDGIIEHDIPFYYFKRGEEGRRERYQVVINTKGTHEQAIRGETETGRTIARLLGEGEEGVRIPRGLDVERFWTVLEDCLRQADEWNAKLKV